MYLEKSVFCDIQKSDHALIYWVRVSLGDAHVSNTVRGCLSLVLDGAKDDDTTAAAPWLAVILLQ